MVGLLKYFILLFIFSVKAIIIVALSFFFSAGYTCLHKESPFVEKSRFLSFIFCLLMILLMTMDLIFLFYFSSAIAVISVISDMIFITALLFNGFFFNDFARVFVLLGLTILKFLDFLLIFILN